MSSGHLLLCRPGFEPVLAAEAGAALGREVRPGAGTVWVADGPLLPPFVFERQRLPAARWFPAEGEGPLARRLLAWIAAALGPAPAPWVLHAYTADPQGTPGLAGRAARLGTALAELCAREQAALAARRRADPAPPLPGRCRVAQVCLLPEGAWASVAAAARLSSPWPAGVHRLPADPAAPSRSYLKLEEALELLGATPRPRERVVDLGAAPGGWTYAFLRRGCQVWAIDNGPLKLGDPGQLPGRLTHLRADGMSYRPAAAHLPLDWLVADMLITPGQALGLLRKWLEGRWMRRFVVNVKLPQRDPLVALGPITAFLAGQGGVSWRMRHLYHDRREVTVVGEVTRGAPARQRKRRGR